MRVTHSGGTMNSWVGWVQDVPSGSFTITSKVHVSTFLTGSAFRVGIFLAEDVLDGGSKLYSCHLHHANGTTYEDDYSQYQSTSWTDHNTPASSNETVLGPFPGSAAWVRLAYKSSDSRCTAVISTDGIRWLELERLTPLSFTPVKMGIGMWNDNGTSEVVSEFEFFAVAEGSGRDGVRGYGRMVPIIVPV